MAGFKIRAGFDDLARTAKIFSQQAQSTRQTLQKINSALSALQGGDWVGKGANQFYAEMERVILPAINRLIEALEGAGTLLGKIDKLMHQAEDEASALFKAIGLSGILGGLAGAVAGAAGAAAAGLAGAAGAAAGTAGATGGAAASSLGGDPSHIFASVNLQALIGAQFQGTGPELGRVMDGLAQSPGGEGANDLLIELSGLRGRGTIEITIEFGKFQDLQTQQAAAEAASDSGQAAQQAAEAAGGGGGGSQGYQGSLTQMRYGKIVGDALGVDPAFGAMLNPSGGLLGPGHFAIAGGSSPVGYHAVAHAAAGYLLTNHNLGPGINYMGVGQGASASHRAGIAYWKAATGGSSALGSSGDWVMSNVAGSIGMAGSVLHGVRSLF
jgi:WXG100 family type VII secretion target